MPDTPVARALTFFATCDDAALLRDVLRSIRARAATAVSRDERRGRNTPPPAAITPATEPASREEALRTVRATTDFAQLQAQTRAIGRRVEELQSTKS